MMQPPYNSMVDGDVFQSRIAGSIPLLWQKFSGQAQLLCAVPSHLSEAFPVVQEWQQLSSGQGYVLRLDYLNYLPLPAGPNTHHAANLLKLKAALNIGTDVNLIREVQVYHCIERLYDLSQRTQVLMNLGFFRKDPNPKTTASALPILRVRVPELTNQMDVMDPKLFSDQALRQLQDIKYRGHQRRQIHGKIFLKEKCC